MFAATNEAGGTSFDQLMIKNLCLQAKQDLTSKRFTEAQRNLK